MLIRLSVLKPLNYEGGANTTVAKARNDMSKRQEDFIDAGIAYRMKHSKPMCIAGSNLADVERDFNRVMPFEEGAEHGYQYAVEKAFDILSQMLYTKRDDEHPAQHYTRSVESMGKFVSQTDFLNQFKQKMQ